MSALFSPGTIGSMKVKNRVVRSATVECLASDDGAITDQYLRAYRILAKGGVGLVIPGNYYVSAQGRAIPRVPLLDKDEIIPDLKRVVDVAHEYDVRMVAQLNHGGRQCNPKVLGGTPLAPSPVRDMVNNIKPRGMTEGEIEDTIAAFGKAARRAKEAGFDGVQIHAAHGYLVNEFLSGHTNRRTDQWGGSLENRMRFLVETYKTVRKQVGPDYPILVKINSEDYIKRGVTVSECVATCRKLDEMGIAAIEVSGGIAERGLSTIKGDVPIDLLMRNRNVAERLLVRFMEKSLRKWARFEEGYFVSNAAEVKKHVKAPVIAVGGMRRRAMMEHVLKSGQADFISMSRPFIRQPNLVSMMQKGNGDVISCTSCNRCSLEIVAHYNPLRCYAADANQ
jgi:2,4-dienoyl-CoA reductase-like NADH-dependent reductase (Old Yellow Enzyme family)